MVAPSAVQERIATIETSHLAPFEWLSGIPVLGILDAMTVEYQVLDRAVLQRDLERVQRFYRARGFFEARVTAGRIVPTPSGGVRVTIEVEEGEPVHLVEVLEPRALIDAALVEGESREAALVAGAAVGRLLADYANTPLQDGPRCSEPDAPRCAPRPRFDEQRYDDTKRALSRALADAGFARAKVEGRVDVELVRHEARVTFTVTLGPLCRFGRIRIEGNGEVPVSIVRQRLGFAPGDRYSAVKVDAAQEELAELGVFGSVEVAHDEPTGATEAAARGPAEPAVVPIVVSLQPVKLRTLKLGVGAQIGSQAEAHAVVGWEDRNLLGGLRSLAVEARPGLVFFPVRADTLFSRTTSDLVPELTVLGAFRQPSFLEARTDLRVEVAGRIYAPQIAPSPDPVPEGFNIVGYYEVNGAFGLDRRFRFPRQNGSLYLGGFLRAQLDVPFSYNRDALPPEYERVIVPYVDALASWDQRIDRAGKPTRVDPSRGQFAALDAQVAFGDARDVRLQPEFRVFRPIADRLVLALRWTLGALFPFNYGASLSGARLVECNETVPAPPECSRDLQLLGFRAFYSGGPFSNRGYGFREVGPHGQLQFATQRGQLSEFLPTGGMAMWELSGELRLHLGPSLSWVAFVDASDVVRTLGDFRADHPHLSPGTGLRLATPVGPLRLDVGFRPPYLQWLGRKDLAPDEGGPGVGVPSTFPWAWSLAVGEAF